MVDWNMIRYITDKIGQGEDPLNIKKELIDSGYDLKLINESFNQAIPWLKPEDQKKIQNLQQAVSEKHIVSEKTDSPQPALPQPSSLRSQAQTDLNFRGAQPETQNLRPILDASNSSSPTQKPIKIPINGESVNTQDKQETKPDIITVQKTEQETQQKVIIYYNKWFYISIVIVLLIITLIYFLRR